MGSPFVSVLASFVDFAKSFELSSFSERTGSGDATPGMVDYAPSSGGESGPR